MAKTIITLGREYCTGGRYIAEDVANALGIKLYDKELITMAAKHSGLSEEAVAASEKRHTHSLLYSLYTMGNELPLGDQVFILQSRIIKQLADEGPCVIVGRCGDYVLRDRKDVLRIFVYAPKEWRLAYGKENNMLQAKDEKGIKDDDPDGLPRHAVRGCLCQDARRGRPFRDQGCGADPLRRPQSAGRVQGRRKRACEAVIPPTRNICGSPRRGCRFFFCIRRNETTVWWRTAPGMDAGK